MQLHIHGARGSSVVSGPAFARYGGHTTCYEIVTPEGQRLIVDAGSGLIRLQAALPQADDAQPFEATVLLTHFHWDHLLGLAAFRPLYLASSKMQFIAIPPAGHTIESALDGAIRPPWWPVRFLDATAKKTFQPISEGTLRVGDVEVTALRLNHPGGVTGYRLEAGGRALVIATDVQIGDPASDAALGRLAEGANVLVHDAQYTPEEWVTTRRGWGHSTWEQATAVASAAHVDRLVLTSHDVERTDDDIDTIVLAARERFAATDAAFEGQVIDV
ncbi:MAG: MBL fold metallo-hydrolase [Dehalococcoidia bacterium]|nr:MAG: MBL fold metallo-hydrolase [Dehalococcoidia bacterium]